MHTKMLLNSSPSNYKYAFHGHFMKWRGRLVRELIVHLKLGMRMFQFRGGHTDFAFIMTVAMDFFRAQVSLWGCNFSS